MDRFAAESVVGDDRGQPERAATVASEAVEDR